jgi:hypothetical protein
MPYKRLAAQVLADWLEVQRTLELVSSGTREAALLRTEARHLRDEYDRLVVEAVLLRRPVPPPFPAV